MTLLLMLLMAAAADWLSCEWHGARERGHLVRLGALSAVIEVLNWVPVYIAIVRQDVTLVGAAVVGSVIGAVAGGYREKRRRGVNLAVAYPLPRDADTPGS